MAGKSVLFISDQPADHASEELWSRTAMALTDPRIIGFLASVPGWSPLHWRTQNLRSAGVRVQVAPHALSAMGAWLVLYILQRKNKNGH